MNRANWTDKRGHIHPVKNLGWLLRHAAEVERFTIVHVINQPRTDPGWQMRAHMTEGREYRINWASREVLVRWLRRPSFRGVQVTWPD